MSDWAEARQLYAAGLSKAAIAERLGMSRNTVRRLVEAEVPPRYVRRRTGSKLDPFKDAIAAMLAEDPKVPATVILDRIRRQGYAGQITILKDHLIEHRPAFVAARGYQRTSYLPGELAQVDWWHTGVQVPVGRGATREAFAMVTSLPQSAAHACVFSFSKTSRDYARGLVAGLGRLGGVPDGIVSDNDTSIIASRRGGQVRLVPEVAALYGALGTKPIVLGPRKPYAKGVVERTISYIEGSFLPLREFRDIDDLQYQHDRWATEVAFERRHRRVGAKVADAWRTERGWLSRLPDPLPDLDRRLEVRVSKDGFIRVGDVDYSVPPGLGGRRVSVRLSSRRVHVFVDGKQVAQHARTWVPADVVLHPDHARALRLSRQARQRLDAGDIALPEIDLGRWDQAVGVST